MDGTQTAALNLQVGIKKDGNSQIVLEAGLFASAKVADLLGGTAAATAETYATGGATSANALETIDSKIKTISERVTKIGAAQNRVESAIEAIAVQSENVTSSLSTLRDADVAEESSKFIQSQILQQAAATLLSTANQTPSIALNLI